MDKKSRLLFKESKFSTGVMYLTDDAMLCDDRDIEAGRCTIKTREGRVKASVPSRERRVPCPIVEESIISFLVRKIKIQFIVIN